MGRLRLSARQRAGLGMIAVLVAAPWLGSVASASTPESGNGTATVTVTPSDNLTAATTSVDVSGAGYAADATLSVGECTATLSDCVSVVTTTTDGSGNFGPIPIALSPTVASTTCGASGCSILAIDHGLGGAFATHHLSFAPATPIAIAVTPDIGLTASTGNVSVTGSGFPANATVSVAECTSQLVPCGQNVLVTTDSSGTFGPTSVPVSTSVGNTSCVPSGCTILAIVDAVTFATHPITFALPPPPAVISVTPTTGLPAAPGTVSVTGDTFAPGSQIQVAQCLANATLCNTPTFATTADGSGHFGPVNAPVGPAVGPTSCVPAGCIVLVIGFDPATGFVFRYVDLGFVPTTTTISTQASPGGPVGTAVYDVVTVSGGFSPTGTVVFSLYNSNTCAVPVFSSTTPLGLGGTATSSSFTPTAPGTYYWTAIYSGDVNNKPATSGCNAPNESVTLTAGPSAKLTLSPKTAANAVDTQQCVAAAVVDQYGNPTRGVTVRFSVTGATSTGGSAVTNGSGQASFCYTGPALPGTDTIKAFADTNGDGSQGTTEPFDTAAKTWTVPPNTAGCTVTLGPVTLTASGDKVTISVKSQGKGNKDDDDPDISMNVKSTLVQALTCSADGKSASVFGQVTIYGKVLNYRADLRDLSTNGKSDTYRIRLSNGYDSGVKVLSKGNIQIRR